MTDRGDFFRFVAPVLGDISLNLLENGEEMSGKTGLIVVGAGLAGSVIAERFATTSGKDVLVLEKKKHIGGHCRDYVNSSGILVHQHGPHIFHTESNSIWKYLSRHTGWHEFRHEVVAVVDEQLLPIPFNINSIERAFPEKKAEAIIEQLRRRFPKNSRIPILDLRRENSPIMKDLADFVYERIFRNYTQKQWGGRRLEDLPGDVAARVPVVTGRNNSYFSDRYQGIPEKGYSELITCLLPAKKHPCGNRPGCPGNAECERVWNRI